MIGNGGLRVDLWPLKVFELSLPFEVTMAADETATHGNWSN